MASTPSYGVVLPNGSQTVHGSGVKVMDPFIVIPVTLHELSPGHSDRRPAFRGEKLGTLVYERIFVIGGVALVELGGKIYVIPPQTLVTIAPGVPHTWTACPKGVNLSKNTGSNEKDEIISEGRFLMLYEYEETTGFFPTAQTETLTSVEEYVRCDDLESIRIPLLTAQEVESRCWFVKDDEIFQAQEEPLKV
ncbi:hypothetical protein V2G26_007088 [Clonostachys chloroleuca]